MVKSDGRNAAAPGGDRGSGGDAKQLDWPHYSMGRVQRQAPAVALPWAGRRAADLCDCAQAILDGARLGPLERAVIGRLRRRLARAVPPPPAYSAPEASGGPASWAATDAARAVVFELAAAGLVTADAPATRQAVGAALQVTADAAYLNWADSAALAELGGREVGQ